MFCPYCGKETFDGAAFCPGCGKPFAGTPAPTPVYPANYPAQGSGLRQAEMNTLYQAKNYFLQRKDLFTAYKEATKLLVKYGRGASSRLMIFGSIVFGLAMIFLIAFGASLEAEEIMQAMPYLLILGILPGSLMIVGGIFKKVNGKKKSAEVRKNYADAAWRIYEYYTQYPNCPVGYEYCDPEVIDVFLEYLESGRTDTIKESVNRALKDADWGDMEDYKDDIKDSLSGSEYKTAPTFAARFYFEP